MKAAQLRSLPAEQLVEKYRELSARHWRAIEAGQPKAANRDFDVLVAINRELRSRGVEDHRKLLELLNDPDPRTRCWAATDVLEFAPREGEQVLAELAKAQRGLVGFTAERVLKQWKDGTFRPL